MTFKQHIVDHTGRMFSCARFVTLVVVLSHWCDFGVMQHSMNPQQFGISYVVSDFLNCIDKKFACCIILPDICKLGKYSCIVLLSDA